MSLKHSDFSRKTPRFCRVRSGGLQAAAFHMAGAVMSHCPASGIAPCPDGVKNPSDASARGRTRSLSCSPSNLRGRQGGQPACRSHSASWSMTPRAHCSQQQAVAARPTTRSSSLFVSTFSPPLRHRHGFTACSVAGRHRRLDTFQPHVPAGLRGPCPLGPGHRHRHASADELGPRPPCRPLALDSRHVRSKR